MSNRITHVPFGNLMLPRKIEDDQMFLGWNRVLPRLWYLDQRQASRLDAESLYGAQQFASFYNRTQFTKLDEPIQVGAIGSIGYYRVQITDLSPFGVSEAAARTVNYTRTVITDLNPTFSQDVHVVRPSGGPVGPVVHPITGADQVGTTP